MPDKFKKGPDNVSKAVDGWLDFFWRVTLNCWKENVAYESDMYVGVAKEVLLPAVHQLAPYIDAISSLPNFLRLKTSMGRELVSVDVYSGLDLAKNFVEERAQITIDRRVPTVAYSELKCVFPQGLLSPGRVAVAMLPDIVFTEPDLGVERNIYILLSKNSVVYCNSVDDTVMELEVLEEEKEIDISEEEYKNRLRDAWEINRYSAESNGEIILPWFHILSSESDRDLYWDLISQVGKLYILEGGSVQEDSSKQGQLVPSFGFR